MAMSDYSKRTIVMMPFIIILAVLYSQNVWALRCGTELVSEGDRKIEVLKACGEPVLKDYWDEETIAFQGDNTVLMGEKGTHTVEVWTYNFGPTRFMQFLRFVNGRLDTITTGPHGFSTSALTIKKDSACGNLVSEDDRKIEVLIKCGEPTTKDYRTIERIVKHKTKDRSLVSGRKVYINVEEWTYNFGPTHFLLFITLENGVVVNIETGEHGF